MSDLSAPAAAPSRAFDDAMAFVFKDEGGFAIRNTEGGGAVNMGVALTVFAQWRTKQGKPYPTIPDLERMTAYEAKMIYRALFADTIRFDDLPVGVGYLVLDSAVNNGITGAMRILARALGTDAPTPGHGPTDIMLAAIAQHGPEGVINAFCDERLRQQKTFKNYKALARRIPPITFGWVWDRRVNAVRKRALAMLGARRTTDA